MNNERGIMKRETITSLRKERDLLRAVIDTVPDCHIFLKDRRSRFIITNRYQLKILGLSSRDEIVGKRDFDFFPREMAEKFYRDEQKIVKTGMPLINREEKTVDREHQEYWLLTTKVPIFSVRGKVVGIAGVSREIGTGKKVIGIVGLSRDITPIKRLQQEREKLIKDLQDALSKIKVLSGLIPICAECKKIRNDKGYWQQVEVYVHEHSDADFTHGYCPECAKKAAEEIDSIPGKPPAHT
jgi:PAS domain S-box-containing protein